MKIVNRLKLAIAGLGLGVMALAHNVVASTLNITLEMQPVLDLLDFMPLVIERLPTIVISLAVLGAIIIAIGAVTTIFTIIPLILYMVVSRMGKTVGGHQGHQKF